MQEVKVTLAWWESTVLALIVVALMFISTWIGNINDTLKNMEKSLSKPTTSSPK